MAEADGKYLVENFITNVWQFQPPKDSVKSYYAPYMQSLFI